MKTLATIVLSLIAIVASLALIISGTCALNGDITGHQDASYVIYAIVSLAVVVAAMWANRKLDRKN
ncbi:MAG TPA: hypothetical protein VKR60_15395 [Candidatus Sulfotelmatobacter sp.]|nr:hypothetical protein [Candidatus Sulfotelmatobacter sp.]